jgi:HEAT repeat protein
MLLVLVVLAAPACKRTTPAGPPAPAPRPRLGTVTVRDLTPPDSAPARIDTAAMERTLRERLLATGQFETDAARADAGAGGVTRALTQLGIEGAEVGDKGVARARVAIRLDTRPSDAPAAVDENLEAAAEQPYPVARRGATGAPPAKQAVFERLVLRVASDLVDGFGARRHLRTAAPAELRAAIAADGGELRLEAIRAIGERKLTGEGDALLGLLDDPDETTRDAALGALISLGDRRAVTSLTRSRSLRDRREMRKIIEAISILGGQEADDYLAFVASSHDDEEIRADASAARARLQRRQADGRPNPP